MMAWLFNHWKILAGIAAIAAVIASFAMYRQSLINEGWDRAIKQVEQQNDAARDAARKVQRGVDDCYDTGGVWSTITGECTR